MSDLEHIKAEAKVIKALYEDRDLAAHGDLWGGGKDRDAYDSALATEFQSMSAKDMCLVLDQIHKDDPCYSFEIKTGVKNEPKEIDVFETGIPFGRRLEAQIQLDSTPFLDDGSLARVAKTLYMGRLSAQSFDWFGDRKQEACDRQAFESAIARQLEGLNAHDTKSFMTRLKEQKPGFDFAVELNQEGKPVAINCYEHTLFQGKLLEATVNLTERSK